MAHDIINGYEADAHSIATKYLDFSSEELLEPARPWWPNAGARVLDIGAGPGRDALFFAQWGCDVVAVEPC